MDGGQADRRLLCGEHRRPLRGLDERSLGAQMTAASTPSTQPPKLHIHNCVGVGSHHALSFPAG
jgi:hypothetical protein